MNVCKRYISNAFVKRSFRQQSVIWIALCQHAIEFGGRMRQDTAFAQNILHIRVLPVSEEK